MDISTLTIPVSLRGHVRFRVIVTFIKLFQKKTGDPSKKSVRNFGIAKDRKWIPLGTFD